MRSILKIAVSLFSTLAIANVMAQCGPYGCGVQRGYSGGYPGGYSRGSTNPGYYDQYGRQYHGYQGSYPMYNQAHQGYYDMNHDGIPDQGYSSQGYYGGGGHDFQQGQGYYQGGGSFPDQAYRQHQGGGSFPDQAYEQPHGGGYQHQDASGMSQRPADHPVNDHSGQPIRYYGKPGPDYNGQNRQPATGGGMQQAPQSPQGNTSANPQTSYNYAPTYDWNSIADADATSANRGGGTSSTTYPYGSQDPNQAAKDSSTGTKSTSTSSSKW